MFENSSEELAYHKLLILYILDKINKEDCDIAVITGFRLNHNKNIKFIDKH